MRGRSEGVPLDLIAQSVERVTAEVRRQRAEEERRLNRDMEEGELPDSEDESSSLPSVLKCELDSVDISDMEDYEEEEEERMETEGRGATPPPPATPSTSRAAKEEMEEAARKRPPPIPMEQSDSSDTSDSVIVTYAKLTPSPKVRRPYLEEGPLDLVMKREPEDKIAAMIDLTESPSPPQPPSQNLAQIGSSATQQNEPQDRLPSQVVSVSSAAHLTIPQPHISVAPTAANDRNKISPDKSQMAASTSGDCSVPAQPNIPQHPNKGPENEEEEDWSEGLSTHEMIRRLLLNPPPLLQCNRVLFLLGPEKVPLETFQVPLALQSSFFRELFYREKERNVLRGRRTSITVVLEDVDVVAFRMVLKLMSLAPWDTGDLRDISVLIRVLFLLKRFDLHSYVPTVTTYLRIKYESEMNGPMALKILDAAVQLEDEHLKALALRYITRSENVVDVFCSAEFFHNLSLDGLCAILSSDDLSIREYTIWERTVQWAEAQFLKLNNREASDSSEIREFLGRALYLVRFPLFTSEEYFEQTDRMKYILTSEERIKIFEYIARPNPNMLTEPFSKQPRRLPSPPDIKVDVSSRENSAVPGHSSNPEEESEMPSSSTAEIAGPLRKRRRISRSESTHSETSFTSNSVEDGPTSSSNSTTTAHKHGKSPLKPDTTTVTATPTLLLLEPSQVDYINLQLGTHDNPHTLRHQYQVIKDQGHGTKEILFVEQDGNPLVLPVGTRGNADLSPLHLPQLEKFHVHYLRHFQKSSNFSSYLKQLDLMRNLLFAQKHGDELFKLWGSEISIDIRVNGLPVLKTEHGEGEETLLVSRIDSARRMFEGPLEGQRGVKDVSEDYPLRHLFLEKLTWEQDTHLLQLFPTSCLETLTFRDVLGVNGWAEFFRECHSIVSLSFNNVNEEVLDLERDFGLMNLNADRGPSKLKKLALGKAALVCPKHFDQVESSSLEELYLTNSSISKTLAENIDKILPSLKRVTLDHYTVRKCTATAPQLVMQLMKMPSMEFLAVSQLDLSSTKKKRMNNQESKQWVRDQLLLSGIEDKGSKVITFVLERVPPGEWEGRKLKQADYYPTFMKLDFEHFGYSVFYPNIDLFKAMNK